MSCVHNFDEPINRVNTDSFKWDYEGNTFPWALRTPISKRPGK